ncbi:MAG: acylphosphatase, partial [Clostridiales bacterium]
MIKRYAFQVHGIVQGVGFRPFVYNLATELDLQGWVLNGAMGVAMEIQGDAVACGEFQRRLVAQPPPLARIDDLQITEIDVANDHGFIIRQSATGQRKTLISPDMATCDECLADLNDPHSRMYGYPFVNCTNCGPRFTIIEDIPYDRA